VSEDNELRAKIRKAQDDSWEAGYSAGQFNDPRTPPADVSWPSHWRVGYDAAVEDKEKKS